MLMTTLLKNLRYGMRALLKQPGFTITALLTLALGIGANTAIFSVLDAVLLKPLPFEEPDHLVMVWEKPPRYTRNSVSAANFLDWKNQNKVFSQIAARSGRSFNLSGLDQPEKIPGALVSATYFDLLGVRAALGRTFLSEEDKPGNERVVILTHRLWQQRFGADAGLIGRNIMLDGEKYTVVGVLKPDSNFDRGNTQLFAPLAFDSARASRSSHFLTVFARLNDGVTLEQAQADMDAIAVSISEQYPDTNRGWGVTIDRLRDQVISKDLQKTLLILFGAVFLILLIACANLANLTLARTSARQKEISIRAALGASRRQLATQFLTESVLLAFVGGVLGAGLGWLIVKMFTSLIPSGALPAEAEIALDYRVLLFTLGLSIMTGIAFGLIPALQASNPDLNDALKEGSRSSTAGSGRRYVSNMLIVSEVALALVLLIGSGLLIRSLFQLQQVDVGFRPENVLTMHVSLPRTKYQNPEQTAVFYNEVMHRIESIPGVESAGMVTDLPIVGWSYGIFFDVESRPSASPSERPAAHLQVVSPDYFRTLSIPVLKGRSFTEQDHSTSRSVVVINETLARRYFADEDPIGKHMTWDSNPPKQYEIVGIVSNVKVYGLGDKAPEENAEAYVPFAQNPQRDSYIAVRTSNSPMRMAGTVKNEILQLDSDQPVTQVRSLEQIISDSLSDEKFNTLLLVIFAAVAVALAAVGIYGIISYTVTQNTREIGIRMALGAQKRDVLRLVIGQGMILTITGVGIGLAVAFVITRVMESLLYQVSVTDSLTFAVTPLLLAAVALLACYIPAHRATKVDPGIALRYE
jgi:putative ABC transport system permease protein